MSEPGQQSESAGATPEAGREPLDAAALRAALPDDVPHGVDVVAETDSTNARLLELARAGAGDRSVLLADHQSAGRGRLGRAWTAPPRTQLAMSVLLRPGDVAGALLGWLPLVTGLAVHRVLRREAGIAADLKWPNDVLVDGRKIAGILVEATSVTGGGDFAVRLPALVVGIGLNVDLTREELPVAHATSVRLEGGSLRRGELAVALIAEVHRQHDRWLACRRGSGSTVSPDLAEEYRRACATLGARVRIDLPAGRTLEGRAEGLDAEGRLVVAGPDGPVHVAAGDVTHLRRPDGGM